MKTALPWRGAVVPLLLLAWAEAAVRQRGAPSDAFAAPSQVLQALWTLGAEGSLWQATGETLYSAFGGLALGGGIGLLIGTWLGLSRGAAQAAALSVELLRPVPSVALIPVALLVFGFGPGMELAVVAFACSLPMLLLAQAAVRGVEPRLLEVAQVLGLSAPATLTKLVLPAALPRLFVAFRLGVGIALVVAVTTEIAANPRGLGYGMINAQQSLAPERMLALLAWVGLLGGGLNAALSALQQRCFGRYRAQDVA